MNEQYPILFLPSIAEAIEYKTRGFGPQPNVPQRERQPHGERLINSFQAIWAEVQTLQQARLAVAKPVKSGAYIEFISMPDFDLVTKSLEDIRAGVKLLNIREHETDGIKQTFATVFIPSGKEAFFIKKFRAYLDKIDRRSDLPCNFNLVNSIEHIRLAVLESFWTDPIAIMPNDNSERFFELWLKTSSENQVQVISETREICEFYSIEFFETRVLTFPERTVCLVRCNTNQLLELIETNPHLAEIRLAKETAAFWVNQTNIDQIAWTDELLGRMDLQDLNVSVCILDTGINNAHPLLNPVLSDNDCNSYDPSWGATDDDGHGTLMGGVAVFGNLEKALEENGPITINHRLSSVKILPPVGNNHPDLYGAITQQAISIAEIKSPDRTNIFCCAVTSSDIDHKGRPTSWSAAVDSITSGQIDGERRLYIASAGNVQNHVDWAGYPDRNIELSIQDPAQSWNALTVGAYTEKVIVTDAGFAGHQPLAPLKGLSPFSTCSSTWEGKWPIKPEIVLEGGNLRQAPDGSLYENFPDFSILSTSSETITNQFDTFCATSAASAHAAWLAAKIQAKYPDIWPETVKGLMVHSAEWPQAIINQFGFDISRKKHILQLMRICGFGVPNPENALFCDSTVLTLVAQQPIQPFKFGNDGRPIQNDMHLFKLPWPKDELLSMGATQVKLRITLCHFIEPGPGEIGWKEKYRYASHGLRFEVNNTNETEDDFVKRINLASRVPDEQIANNSGADRWVMGADNRVLGSIHSDIWEGNAADIASCNMIGIYPVMGWWRERKHLGNVEKSTRYSLIVSLITPPQDVNIYTPVESIIRVPVEIQTITRS